MDLCMSEKLSRWPMDSMAPPPVALCVLGSLLSLKFKGLLLWAASTYYVTAKL